MTALDDEHAFLLKRPSLLHIAVSGTVWVQAASGWSEGRWQAQSEVLGQQVEVMMVVVVGRVAQVVA